MKGSKIGFLLLFSILLAGISSGAQEKSPIVGRMVVKKVVVQDNVEEFVSADSVNPDDVMEYIVTYVNHSDKDVKDIKIIGPIPEGSEYIDGSEVSSESLLFEASIDAAQTFMEPPIYYEVVLPGGNVEMKLAGPEMYTHLRWVLLHPFAPDQEIEVKYRVRVK